MSGREFNAVSRLAAIVESSGDAILSKTLEGVITSWNAGAAHMYGYAPDEIVGHNVSELIPPDRAGELGTILDRLRAGGAGRAFRDQASPQGRQHHRCVGVHLTGQGFVRGGGRGVDPWPGT